MRGPAKPADPSPTDAHGQGHRLCTDKAIGCANPPPLTRYPSRTRVMPALRRKVAGPCWDESKGFGQGHWRACLMLKRWAQPARPGRPGASAAWTARRGQAESPSRQSRGGPAGGKAWLRPGLRRPSGASRRRLGPQPPAGRPRARGSQPAGARVAWVQVRGRVRRRYCHPGSGRPGCRHPLRSEPRC